MKPFKLLIPSFVLIMIAFLPMSGSASAEENIIDFESAEIGKPIPKWSDRGVTWELAFQPKKSKAVGRVSFFPHLGTGHKGIVNAMANEAIPIKATFENPVKFVKLTLWGSTTSSALVEAFDKDGKQIARASLEQVPVRKTPEELVPFFELSVAGDNISHIEISGSQPGGFVAVDEILWH